MCENELSQITDLEESYCLLFLADIMHIKISLASYFNTCLSLMGTDKCPFASKGFVVDILSSIDLTKTPLN